MPIFHDPPESPPRQYLHTSPPSEPQDEAETPEHSPFQLSVTRSHVGRSSAMSGEPHISSTYGFQGHRSPTIERVELIERLKKAQSPTWSQERRDVEVQAIRPPAPLGSHLCKDSLSRSSTPSNSTGDDATSEPSSGHLVAGLEIERPRSALHSGDFRDKKNSAVPLTQHPASSFLSTSPFSPWGIPFSTPQKTPQSGCSPALEDESGIVTRARALSQSSFRAFTLMPPTSPLVHHASNADFEFPSRSRSRQSSRSPERSNRRHTFSPEEFQARQSTEFDRVTPGSSGARRMRHSHSIPYQAHQPRRSLTTSQSILLSDQQQPCFTPRRPSLASEASPLHHAAMVGSYEESILRGRMSTTPSKPLDFVAKIGVLGKGSCKSSLKCPPHVTIPFPAVFYSYNSGNGRSDNEPSPYVGLIDLEHSLHAPEPARSMCTSSGGYENQSADHNTSQTREHRDERPGLQSMESIRRIEKRKRRSASPKAPPGGCYRIPQQGQLQIVLKNPNKTAVKLFLVPYDLLDMEPGQKTFIRQRSYSAGPLMDIPPLSSNDCDSKSTGAGSGSSCNPGDRPVLRYLIHLHICCTGKGRFYLYKTIRVVFANRVPDGKEKLRNEIQLPEPRYSIYKPYRETTASQDTSVDTSSSTTSRYTRRRSAAWPALETCAMYDQVDGLTHYPEPPPPAVKFTGGRSISSASSSFNSPMPEMRPIPFAYSHLAAIESRPASRGTEIDSKSSASKTFTPPSRRTPTPEGQSFEKLSKGDIGYGGNAFSTVNSPTTSPSASLLSRRLRGFESSDGDGHGD